MRTTPTKLTLFCTAHRRPSLYCAQPSLAATRFYMFEYECTPSREPALKRRRVRNRWCCSVSERHGSYDCAAPTPPPDTPPRMRSERVYEVHRTANGSRWESSRQRESATRTRNDKRVVVGADTPAVKNERCDDAHHTNPQRDYLFPPKQAPRNMTLAWVSRWSDTTPIGRVLMCDHPC